LLIPTSPSFFKLCQNYKTTRASNDHEKYFLLFSLKWLGIISSLLGLFLPWSILTWPNNVMTFGKGFLFSFEILIGSLAATGGLIVFISFLRNFGKINHLSKASL